MKQRLSIVLAGMMVMVLALALSGCDEAATVEPEEGDIQISLTTETTEVAPGESVVFDLAVSNLTETTLGLEFASEMKYDLVISSIEQPVWSWSFEREFELEETQLVVGAEETLNYNLEWPGTAQDGEQLEPGTYEVRAMLLPANVMVDDATLELTVTE